MSGGEGNGAPCVSELVEHSKSLLASCWSNTGREERRKDVYVLLALPKDEEQERYGLKYRGGMTTGAKPELKFRTGVGEKVAGLEQWEKLVGVTQVAKAFQERGIALSDGKTSEVCTITTEKSRINALVDIGSVVLEVAEVSVGVKLCGFPGGGGGAGRGGGGGGGGGAAAAAATGAAATAAAAVAATRTTTAAEASEAAEAAEAAATTTTTTTTTQPPSTSHSWISICVEAKRKEVVEAYLEKSQLAAKVENCTGDGSFVLGGYPTLMLRLLNEARAGAGSGVAAAEGGGEG